MKYIKNIFLLTILAFFVSGCNIYRQIVIPTPYYPNANSGNVQVVTPKQPQEVMGINNQQNNQTNQTQITPIKNGQIRTSNSTVVQRIPFPVDEYATLPKTGEATVSGVIYLQTSGGKKIYGRNTRLYLNPVTSYSTQWYKESYLGGAKMSKVDPRLFNYLKFTTSDENGHFEFVNVPSGSYYLIGVVKCGGECGFVRDRTIRIAKKISVFGNERKEVDLSKTIN